MYDWYGASSTKSQKMRCLLWFFLSFCMLINKSTTSTTTPATTTTAAPTTTAPDIAFRFNVTIGVNQDTEFSGVNGLQLDSGWLKDRSIVQQKVNCNYTILSLASSGYLFQMQFDDTSQSVVRGEPILSAPAALTRSNEITYTPILDFYGNITFLYRAQCISGFKEFFTAPIHEMLVIISPPTRGQLPYSGAGGLSVMFDGNDDVMYMNVNSFPQLEYTLTMWVRSYNTRSLQTLASFVSVDGLQWQLFDTSNLQLYRSTAIKTTKFGLSVNDGEWNHVGFSWRSSTGQVTFFLNGKAIAKVPFGYRGMRMASFGQIIFGQRPLCSYMSGEELLQASVLNTFIIDDGEQLRPATFGVDRYVSLYRKSALQTSSSTSLPEPKAPEYLVCPNTCISGCTSPEYAFHGEIDEVKMWQLAREEVDVVLDWNRALRWYVTLARSNDSLMAYFPFDDHPSTRATNATVVRDHVFRAVPDLVQLQTAIKLGRDNFPYSIPQRVPSTCPIFGAPQQYEFMEVGRATKFYLPFVDTDTADSNMYFRVNRLPNFGKLYHGGCDRWPDLVLVSGDVPINLNVSRTCGLTYIGVQLGGAKFSVYDERDKVFVVMDPSFDSIEWQVLDSKFVNVIDIDPNNPEPIVNTTTVIYPFQVPYVVSMSVIGIENSLGLIQLQYAYYATNPILLIVEKLPKYVTLHQVSKINCTTLQNSFNASCPSFGCARSKTCDPLCEYVDFGQTYSFGPSGIDTPDVCFIPGAPINVGDTISDFAGRVVIDTRSWEDNGILTDSFSFRGWTPDRYKGGNVAEVTIKRRDINSAPVTNGTTFVQTSFNSPVSVPIEGTDDDKDTLIPYIIEFPKFGTLFSANDSLLPSSFGTRVDASDLQIFRQISSTTPTITQTTTAVTATKPAVSSNLVCGGNLGLYAVGTDSFSSVCSAGMSSLEATFDVAVLASSLQLFGRMDSKRALRVLFLADSIGYDHGFDSFVTSRDVDSTTISSLMYSFGQSTTTTTTTTTNSSASVNQQTTPAYNVSDTIPNSTVPLMSVFSYKLNYTKENHQMVSAVTPVAPYFAEEWVEVWRGRGMDVWFNSTRDAINIPFCETSFRTKKVRIEVCNSNAASEPTTWLDEGMQVFLEGRIGEPESGKVETRGRMNLTYLPNTDYFGEDSFQYVQFDCDTRSYQPHLVKLSVLPRTVASSVGSWLVGLVSGQTADLELAVQSSNGVISKTDTVDVLQLPEFAVLRSPSGSKIQSSQLPFRLDTTKNNVLRIETNLGAGGVPFDDFSFAPVGRSQSTVKINVVCQPGRQIDPVTKTCRKCPAGSFSSTFSVDTNSCVKCQTGKYAAMEGMTECYSCSQGFSTNFRGQTACDGCPAGFYAEVTASLVCYPCPLGTFQPYGESSSCWSCGSLSWNSRLNATSCSDCPDNSRSSLLNAPGSSYCSCVYGSYAHDRAPSEPCVDCPEGAHCEGRNWRPVPLDDYYQVQSETEEIIVPCKYHNLENMCVGYPAIDIQKNYDVCQFTAIPGVCSDEQPLPPYEHNATSSCDEGYTGFECTECADGFYRNFRRACWPCVTSTPMYLIFEMLWVGFFWAMLFEFLRSKHFFSAAYILLTWLQLTSMLSDLNIISSPNFMQLFAFCSLFNFHIEYIALQCYGLRDENFLARAASTILLVILYVACKAIYSNWHLKQLRKSIGVRHNRTDNQLLTSHPIIVFIRKYSSIWLKLAQFLGKRALKTLRELLPGAEVAPTPTISRTVSSSSLSQVELQRWSKVALLLAPKKSIGRRLRSKMMDISGIDYDRTAITASVKPIDSIIYLSASAERDLSKVAGGIDAWDRDLQTAVRTARQKSYLSWWENQKEQVQEAGIALFEVCMIDLSALTCVLLKTAVQLLLCEERDYTSYVLTASPDVTCDGPERVYIVVLCLVIISVTVLLPLIGVSWLRFAVVAETLPVLARTTARFWLKPFEPRFWWWGVAVTHYRKVAITLLLLYSSHPAYKIGGMILICLISIMGIAYFKPYRDNKNNILEIYLLSMFFLACTVPFVSPSRSWEEPQLNVKMNKFSVGTNMFLRAAYVSGVLAALICIRLQMRGKALPFPYIARVFAAKIFSTGKKRRMLLQFLRKLYRKYLSVESILIAFFSGEMLREERWNTLTGMRVKAGSGQENDEDLYVAARYEAPSTYANPWDDYDANGRKIEWVVNDPLEEQRVLTNLQQDLIERMRHNWKTVEIRDTLRDLNLMRKAMIAHTRQQYEKEFVRLYERKSEMEKRRNEIYALKQEVEERQLKLKAEKSVRESLLATAQIQDVDWRAKWEEEKQKRRRRKFADSKMRSLLDSIKQDIHEMAEDRELSSGDDYSDKEPDDEDDENGSHDEWGK